MRGTNRRFQRAYLFAWALGLGGGNRKQAGVSERFRASQVLQESFGIFLRSFLAAQCGHKLRERNIKLGLPLRELLFANAARVEVVRVQLDVDIREPGTQA